MMWSGYGVMGYGFWPFHFVVPFIVIGLIVWAVVMAVRATGGVGEHRAVGERYSPGLDSPGLDALDERYAKGEINRDEYLQKRRDISGRE